MSTARGRLMQLEIPWTRRGENLYCAAELGLLRLLSLGFLSLGFLSLVFLNLGLLCYLAAVNLSQNLSCSLFRPEKVPTGIAFQLPVLRSLQKCLNLSL